MKLFNVFLISQFLSLSSFAQKLVQVTDETLTVNSVYALSGYVRNKTAVTLPEKTTGYIYRLSVSPKGNVNNAVSLFELLKRLGGTRISLASSFAEFAIKNNDNNAVDAFIFNNIYDAENFYAKKDNDWSACKSLLNRVNCCFATKDCLNREIYFGFRNNNLMTGLDVRLEVVALVDSLQEANYKYSYTIRNSTDRELNYSLSLDNVNWQEVRLREGYQQNYTFDQNIVYFKIQTDRYKSVAYKLNPNERYKIVWNPKTGRWDLIRY